MTIGNVSLVVTSQGPFLFAQVAGNTTGVTVGTFTLEPKSDSVNLQDVGLSLNATDASSADVLRAYVYEGGSTLVGSVIFSSPPINGYYYATSTISNLNFPQNQSTTFTIRADLAQISTGQGTDGHEVLINLTDAHGVGASSGTVVDSGPLSTAQTGVAMFRTYPTFTSSNYLPSNGVSDGRLIAFTIIPNSTGNVGLYKLTFSVNPSAGTTVTSPSLYVYSDLGFSQPAAGTSAGIAGSTTYSNGTAVTTFSTPLEIPAGSSWYFLLKGTVSPSGTTYNVATTLEGDLTNLAPVMYAASGLSSSNFIWSPNGQGTSAITTPDWTNGYAVEGLSQFGPITENRTN